MIVDKKVAKERIYSIFDHLFVPSNQCDIISENLLLTEMAGISTHGFRMIPDYVNKIKKKQFNLNPFIRNICDTDKYSIYECDNAIGLYSASIVIRDTIKKAKENGIHCSWCRNSNTFGAAFSILERCVSEKVIGICFANSPAQMAPINGLEKLFGTNPLAICIPAKEEIPFVLDMASSVVSKSKINEARDKNTRIPFDWALDEEGYPTDDPYKAQKGFLLPMAGPKGVGISMAIDMLAGFLSGAACLDQVGKFYTDNPSGMNVGQFYMVIDPIKIYGDCFYDDVDNYLKKIRTSKSIEMKQIKYPGMGKYENIMKAREGINIDNKLYETLLSIGW